MSPLEKRAVSGLSFIYVARMLGLFMLMPVLALDNDQLRYSTPLLLGLAIGIYGLAQAVLQFPFGVASDRFGRKRVLVFGILIFVLGSLLGALTHNIWGIILARLLQGAGAVSSVLLATAGDLTGEQHRTKAMAAIGGSIAIAYVLGMALGPVFYGVWGLTGVFLVAAAFGVLALFPLWKVIPPIPHNHQQRMGSWRDAFRMFKHPAVLTASIGIFILQMVLGASFVVLSPELVNAMHIPDAAVWEVYLPVMLLSVAAMIYPVIYAERHKQHGQMLVFSGLAIAAGALIMGLLAGRFWPVAIGAVIFFVGYNIASAILPSMMSRSTKPEQRGAASGVYSLMQFLGIFVGGVVGGWGLGMAGEKGVFYILAVVGLLLALQSWNGKRVALLLNPDYSQKL
ncbi:major facilitator superfamily MFS_1 [Acidithiobacillus ferrivorans SS3]|uniref:Major facilitator superfamily MFS_1 n=2 Tax=Acidithiobacillus ferrivorans TaxID=160808 RepID=G0JKY8_9PROT|nr:MFS transporter [Acidithiobacillus ferrivorans]AEM47985.1 major facilitator superfamily MFS_1 [Acidithiobacillus ferrivorans SS3]MBU2851703.1 MFS transporter [Acidithiobacillus ferrivorans]